MRTTRGALPNIASPQSTVKPQLSAFSRYDTGRRMDCRSSWKLHSLSSTQHMTNDVIKTLTHESLVGVIQIKKTSNFVEEKTECSAGHLRKFHVLQNRNVLSTTVSCSVVLIPRTCICDEYSPPAMCKCKNTLCLTVPTWKSSYQSRVSNIWILKIIPNWTEFPNQSN